MSSLEGHSILSSIPALPRSVPHLSPGQVFDSFHSGHLSPSASAARRPFSTWVAFTQGVPRRAACGLSTGLQLSSSTTRKTTTQCWLWASLRISSSVFRLPLHSLGSETRITSKWVLPLNAPTEGPYLVYLRDTIVSWDGMFHKIYVREKLLTIALPFKGLVSLPVSNTVIILISY